MGFTPSRQDRIHGTPAFIQAGILLVVFASSLPVPAQTTINVQVDYGKEINVMTAQAMGAYTDVYDTNTVNPKIAAYMHTAGMYTLQFPGGSGSYADLYHWSTGSGTNYENFAKQDHFYPGEVNMAHMVPAIDRTGTALITINYGSNLDGTGGGEPAEGLHGTRLEDRRLLGYVAIPSAFAAGRWPERTARKSPQAAQHQALADWFRGLQQRLLRRRSQVRRGSARGLPCLRS